MSRPDKDVYFLRMARLVASRATCARRAVGCVLVDEHGHVLATGYNGVAAGQPHCTEFPCSGADCAPGQGLELCEAIHAEQNALLQCADVQRIRTCYTTTAPCITCTKLLLNTPCERIAFIEEYPHPRARELWVNSHMDHVDRWSRNPQRVLRIHRHWVQVSGVLP